MLELRKLVRYGLRAAEDLASRRGYAVRWLPEGMQDRASQLHADLAFVLPHLLLTASAPFFLEIGANDGRANDPLYPFIARGLISGILLEPMPAVFEQLAVTHAGNPGAHCVNAALAEEDGEAEFFTVDMNGIAFEKAHQFSSFDRSALLKQTAWVPDIADRILPTRVRTVSFATLQRMASEAGAGQIDILHTDTEGFDGRVLDLMWAQGIHPSVVSFERLHMSKAEMSRQVGRFTRDGYKVAMGDADIVAYRASGALGYQ